MLKRIIGIIGNDKDTGERPTENRDTTLDSDEQNKEELLSVVHETSFADIRELSKRQIELFEHWNRRLIDEIFRTNYGEDYVNTNLKEGQPLVKNAVKKRIV